MDQYNLVHYKNHAIRIAENEEEDLLLFSIVDTLAILADSVDARKYWNTLKQRLSKSHPDLIAGCSQASLPARDGRRRMTDVASAPVLSELVKLIPGYNHTEAINFSRWLFMCGNTHDEVLPFQTIPFKPGHALAAISTIQNENLRKIAEAEYAYYTGNAEKAAEIAGLYLDDGEINIRISAAYLYAFANMHLRRLYKAGTAFRILRQSLNEARKYHSAKIQRTATMLLYSIKAIMHMSTEDMEHDIGELVPDLPEGLKTWACYIHCYDLYRQEKYGQILGVVETANAFTNDVYPVPLSYMNAFAAIALVNLDRHEEAKEYLDKVMQYCQPDGLFELLGEMQFMLQGLVDVYIKPLWPEHADDIDRCTNEFFTGLVAMRELESDGPDLAAISKTEFIMAVMACRGWKNKEIANFLGFSQNTVKKYLSNVFDKLNISSRQELADILHH